MKQQSIYAKTNRGAQEMAAESPVLEARYRRFLALVDGRRTVAELKTVSRPLELDATVELLLEQGYIVWVGEAEAQRLIFSMEPRGDDPFADAAMTPEMFAHIRQRAVYDLRRCAGAAAESVVSQIEACETPPALRIALRAAEALLADSIGADAAREFLHGVGRNLVA